MSRTLLVAALVFSACNCQPPSGLDGGAGLLELGEPEVALQATVPPGGGVFTVSNGPLAGLQLRVPAGTWATDTALTVSATAVHAVHRDGVRAGSALISITGAGSFAAKPVTLFVPGEGRADEFAMVFGYERTRGELEGMPSYPEPGGTAFVTQHFSDFLLLLTQYAKLDEAVATPFVFGTDDFALVNEDSAVARDGFCSGQVVAALHYYAERRVDGGAPLVELGDQRRPGLATSTRESQAFYFDDVRAWHVVSAVQNQSLFSFSNLDRWQEVKQHEDPTLTHKLLTTALYVSRLPQLLGLERVHEDGGTTGHAVLAFAKERTNDGFRFLVSDPNWPWRADRSEPRAVEWTGSSFTAYPSRPNALTTTRLYTRFAYFGTWAFIPRESVRALWAKAEADELSILFPEVTLRAVGSTVAGNPDVALTDGLVRSDPRLRVAPQQDVPWRLTVFDESGHELARATTWTANDVEVALKEGDNVLGVRIETSDTDDPLAFRWAGFRWVTVRHVPPQTGAPVVLGQVSFTSEARELDVVGTRAAVMLDTPGLALVDVSQPASPTTLVVANISPHSTGRGVVIGADDWLYAGAGSFKLIDVRAPRSPVVGSSVGFNANCGRLVTRGEYAFVACGSLSYVSEGMLGIASLADPMNGNLSRGVGSITWSTTIKDVALSADGTRAFLLGRSGTVATFDVSNPRAPGTMPLATLSNDATTSFAVDLEGTRLYVAAGELSSIDVSNPAALVRLASDPYRDARDVDAVGTRVVAVGAVGNEGRLWVYDASNPAALTVKHTLSLAMPGTAVKVVGDKAYVTTASTGVGALLIVQL